MLRSKLALVVSLCSVLTLTACSDAVDKAQEATDTVQDAAADTAETAKDIATDTAETAQNVASDTAETAQEAGETVTDTITDAADKAKETVTEILALKDGVAGMTSGVEETITAVQAGDLTKAKEEFDKLQEPWSKIEKEVKSKSGESYQNIEDGMTRIKSALGETEPNKDQLLTDLKEMLTSLGGIVTG